MQQNFFPTSARIEEIPSGRTSRSAPTVQPYQQFANYGNVPAQATTYISHDVGSLFLSPGGGLTQHVRIVRPWATIQAAELLHSPEHPYPYCTCSTTPTSPSVVNISFQRSILDQITAAYQHSPQQEPLHSVASTPSPTSPHLAPVHNVSSSEQIQPTAQHDYVGGLVGFLQVRAPQGRSLRFVD